MESVIATNVTNPDSDSSSFKKPTPTPAVLKTDSRLLLQLKTCDSTDSRLRLHNPAEIDSGFGFCGAKIQNTLYWRKKPSFWACWIFFCCGICWIILWIINSDFYFLKIAGILCTEEILFLTSRIKIRYLFQTLLKELGQCTPINKGHLLVCW